MKWMTLSPLREGEGGGTGGGQQQQQGPWYAGKLDEAGVGYLQNRGWHDKPVEEVALNAITAHREAEKLIGVPADQIIRLPKDKTDEAAWKSVFQKLGAGAEPKDYDLSTVKNAKGEVMDKAVADAIAGAAAKFGITKDAAVGLAAELQKHFDGRDAAAAAEATAKLDAEKAELKKLWGANEEANLFVAKQAALKLGLGPDFVNTIEKAVGYAKTMEMMRDLGMKLGEGKFLAAGENQSGIMTREQAIARKEELMRDTAWQKRYMDGGAAENRELQSLLAIINGTASA